MAVDVHQHLWPPRLVEALRRRTAPPRLDGWTLHTVDAAPYRVTPADHDVARRAEEAVRDGLDRVVVGLSSPLGIEGLPAAEAAPLLSAYHEGVLELPTTPFAAWAAACLDAPDPDALSATLEAGFVGLQLPATALLDAESYQRCAPLLSLLERRDAPLFIHPGPSAPSAPGAPPWWPAVVDYVSQMHAAWFAFHAHGRPAHPRLRVCFALLAGLAPLHGERAAARGGPQGVIDPLAWVETSSYGPRAIDAMLRALGVDVVVHGSDRPYAQPATGWLADEFGPAAASAIAVTNPATLLGDRHDPPDPRHRSRPTATKGGPR